MLWVPCTGGWGSRGRGLAEEVAAARAILDDAHQSRDQVVEAARETADADRDRFEAELNRIESEQLRHSLQAESGRIAVVRSLEAARTGLALVERCLSGGEGSCGDLGAAQEDLRSAEIDLELFEFSSEQRTGELADRLSSAQDGLAALPSDVARVPEVVDAEEAHRDAHAVLGGGEGCWSGSPAGSAPRGS